MVSAVSKFTRRIQPGDTVFDRRDVKRERPGIVQSIELGGDGGSLLLVQPNDSKYLPSRYYEDDLILESEQVYAIVRVGAYVKKEDFPEVEWRGMEYDGVNYDGVLVIKRSDLAQFISERPHYCFMIKEEDIYIHTRLFPRR